MIARRTFEMPDGHDGVSEVIRTTVPRNVARRSPRRDMRGTGATPIATRDGR
jgi:hypothetical protein